MQFFVKRYVQGVVSRQHYFWLILLIPIAYVLFNALYPDEYRVQRLLAVAQEAPYPHPEFASQVLPLKLAIANEYLVVDERLLRRLVPRVEDLSGVRQRVKDTVSFRWVTARLLEMTYQGPNSSEGESFVAVLAQGLLARSEDGRMRAIQLSRSELEASGVLANLEPAQFEGPVRSEAMRSLWRSERLPGLIRVSVLAIVLILVLLGVVEWSDPSFKSDRHVARYLGVPVLGSVGDLGQVLRRLERR